MSTHAGTMETSESADWIIVGSGLAGALAAIRLRERHPEKRGILIEASGRTCGDHTWSLHASDLGDESERSAEGSAQWNWLSPNFRRTWPAQRVRFGDFERRLAIPYGSLDSERLRTWLERVRALDAKGLVVRTGAAVTGFGDGSVELADGTRFAAPLVLDARGWLDPARNGAPVGWQKFTGFEVELSGPHHLSEPVIMDATCEQVDGYRFFYLLPYSSTRLLVEDTRYSDSSTIDDARDAREIEAYCRSRGWRIASILRREKGALPIPLSGGAIPSVRELAELPRGSAIPWGVRAGFFHPVTGYSAAWAVQAAWRIGELRELNRVAVHRALLALRRELAATERFHLFLNQSLFLLSKPSERHRLLSAFHRISENAVGRFYAGRARVADRLAVLAQGAPEVSIFDALRLFLRPRALFSRLEKIQSQSDGGVRS